MWMLAACAPIEEAEVLVAPDPIRTGEPGSDGPFGASRRVVRASARVTDSVPVAIVYPSDADGAIAVGDAPIVVGIAGGLVEPERYAWWASHLATRGIVSLWPDTPLDLAIFEPGNGRVALDLLWELSADDGVFSGLVARGSPVVTAGHSLGGVLAARQWVDDPDIAGLVLLASFPAPGDAVEDTFGRPVLALGGTEDGSAPIDRITEEVDRFPGPLWFGAVEGMTHYAWTDDPSPGELDGDGVLGRALPVLRADASRAIDLYLDGVFGDGDLSALDAPLPGITWVR